MKRDGGWRVIRYSILGVALLCALGGCAFAALYASVRRGERETVQRPADAIIVLGAQVHVGGRPSAALRGRVRRGVELYQYGYAPRIVMTGGVGESGIAEAVVMQALAVGMGVPEEAIILEPQAARTVESAEHVGALARAAGWDDVIVVSDPFHLRRSALLFAAQGLAVQTAGTDDRYFSPQSRRYYRLREVAALIVQMGLREIPLSAWRA